MPNEREAKLKLVHLLWMLMIGAICVGIAVGTLLNQQGTNTESIDQKVEKEVFSQHEKYQYEQFTEIKESLIRIEKKL